MQCDLEMDAWPVLQPRLEVYTIQHSQWMRTCAVFSPTNTGLPSHASMHQFQPPYLSLLKRDGVSIAHFVIQPRQLRDDITALSMDAHKSLANASQPPRTSFDS